jgi:hypothetical protein
MDERLFVFVFLYGTVSLIGAFLSFFWARIARQRARSIPHPAIKDRAFVLASSIALSALGLTISHGVRAVGNVQFGLSSILKRSDAYPIGFGLIILIAGMLLQVWLADLQKHPPRWIMVRWMIGLTMLWAIVAALLVPGVPFD